VKTVIYYVGTETGTFRSVG